MKQNCELWWWGEAAFELSNLNWFKRGKCFGFARSYWKILSLVLFEVKFKKKFKKKAWKKIETWSPRPVFKQKTCWKIILNRNSASFSILKAVLAPPENFKSVSIF